MQKQKEHMEKVKEPEVVIPVESDAEVDIDNNTDAKTDDTTVQESKDVDAAENEGGLDSIDGLKIIDGKADGKIPLEDFNKIRLESIHNVDSDTITLGKYKPTVNPDGTLDWKIPGADSYTVMAGDTTYFSLGNDWDIIKSKYNLTDKDMFELFNVPALDDAVKSGKEIRFSHDPTAYGDCALKNEWLYLKDTYGYTRLKKIGDFWYAK